MKQYTIKKNPQKNACKIWGCKTKKYKARGLCAGHHKWFSVCGRLEEFADPDKKVYFFVTKYRIRKRITKGICRIFEDGVTCKRKVHRRGMCTKHCSMFHLHGVYEKYAAPTIQRQNQ